MRAIRTASTPDTAKLGNAGPEHDLPLKRGLNAGADGLVEAGDPCYHLPYSATVWEPTHEERAHLAIGRNVRLLILGTGVPPVAMGITDEGPIDDAHAHAQPRITEPHVWMALPRDVVEDLVAVITTLERRAVEAEAQADVDLEPGLGARIERLVDLRDQLLRPLEAHDEEAPDA